jgi:hypothetical protein
VDEPDINEPDTEPDQYVFTDIMKIYSFTPINIRNKKELIYPTKQKGRTFLSSLNGYSN